MGAVPESRDMAAWYFAETFLYVVGIPERVKIGKSRQPARRILSIEAQSPVPIHTYAIVPEWYGGDEATIHAAWHERRRRFEWFDVDDAMKEWIGQMREKYLEYEARRPVYAATLEARCRTRVEKMEMRRVMKLA